MIREANFRHAGKPWIVLFESQYVNPNGGKQKPDRTPENLRITWSIRQLRDGAQDLCLSGHWSQAKGVYSVDRMTEKAPRGSIRAAFARQGIAKRAKYESFRCCPGISTKAGVRRGWHCDICTAVLANPKVMAGVKARKRRLFDKDLIEDAA